MRTAAFLPGGLWSREWLVTVSRPRALALRVAMPLALAIPLVAGGAPSFWAAMLLTVLVAMVGAVGTAVTLARARASGLLSRLGTAPADPARLAAGWVGAAAAVDSVQLLPALAVLLLARPSDPLAWLALLLSVAATLLVANAAGAAVALVAGDPGEVLVGVAVTLAPLLFLGGLFTGVPREGWRAWAAAVDPFGYLHSAFVAALGGSPSHGRSAVVAAALVSGAAAAAALAALGRPLLRGR